MKNKYKKIAAAAAILAVFLVAAWSLQYNGQHFEIDKKAFKPESSFENLMKEQYGRLDYLAEADRYHITTNLGKEVEVPKMRRAITFHKIWLNNMGTYLLYSLNIRQDDKKPKDLPKLHFNKVIFNLDNGKRKTINTPNWIDTGRNTLDHDFYRGIFFQPQMGFSNDQYHKYQTMLEHVTSVTLMNPKLISSDKEVTLKDIVLPANLNKDKWLIKKARLDQSWEVSPKLKVHFTSYEKYYNYTKVNVELTGGDKYRFAGAEVTYLDPDKPIYDQSYEDRTGLLKENILGIPSGMSTIQMIMEGYKVNTGKTLSISLDNQAIKQAMKDNPNEKKISEIGNSVIFVGRSEVDPRPGHTVISLKFKYKDPSKPYIVDLWPKTKKEAQEIKAHGYSLQNYQILSITDDKGKELPNVEIGNDYTQHDGQVVDLIVENKNIESAKRLDISISNIVNFKKVENPKFILDLEKIRSIS
ncbi:hypothetical protein EV207_1379 [Scopulibacillus darangshiensis]|uniref:DUF4179 domain-containing protein n=1 Tax=Scopulibacillus darangshiensis TaxID=442528 RepID=A0A4R2NKV0_9BACL|nr:hypothetical protein [Scopulibacillus darangshiensis]TCP22121.1 hypothetical protein EV207_1379 [Scopulibacillus darangshiensis]